MFEPQQRQVFEFINWDGKTRYADPMAVWRKLREATQGKFNELVKDARSGEAAVMSPAAQALVNAAVFAFGFALLDPETGEGWLESDVLLLIERYTGYIAQVKKNMSPSPTSCPPTGA